MIAQKTATVGVNCRGLRTCLPTRQAAGISRRNVVLRFKGDDKLSSEVDQLEKQLKQGSSKVKENKLSAEEMDEVSSKEQLNTNTQISAMLHKLK